MGTVASDSRAHAEGLDSIANNTDAHAEGYKTKASGDSAHAEGGRTTASGEEAHAEGWQTTASGNDSHAGGSDSIALGDCSFAHGNNVTAHNNNEVVFGIYNKGSAGDGRLFVIGNGASSSKKNAFEVVKETNYLKIGASRESKNLGYQVKINDVSLNQIIQANLLDALYPVGAIYTSTTRIESTKNTSGKEGCPIADTLGGSWTRIYNVFLYAGDNSNYAAGHTGGHKEAVVVKHTHEIPGHNTAEKEIKGYVYFLNTSNGTVLKNGSFGEAESPCMTGNKEKHKLLELALNATHAHWIPGSTTEEPTVAGSYGAVDINNEDNMPPYLCVYMWKRTA